MPSIWITALKEYNSNKKTWCVPKKDSQDYNEVKKIMEKLKSGENNKGRQIITNEEIKQSKVDKQKKYRENKKKRLEAEKIRLINTNPNTDKQIIEKAIQEVKKRGIKVYENLK
jgi:hypothetical protein